MIKKVILAPDSFRGAASSTQVCKAMALAVKRVCPAIECICVPILEGGEGTLDTFLAFGGAKRVSCTVKGPFLDDTICRYVLLDGGKTAFIEVAEAVGRGLGRFEPLRATTYGVGELVRHALANGAKKIIVSLGDSSSCDGGTGMAVALGTRFFNSKGGEFIPTGATLTKIARIDDTLTNILLKGVDIMAMCDVVNPLCGDNGAAVLFGTQNGVNSEIIKLVDEGLYNMARVLYKHTGVNVVNLSGAGATGGLGGGVAGFLGGYLVSGTDVILDVTGFDKALDGTDVIFTGESTIDWQTLKGRAVLGIAKRAKSKGIPVVVIGNVIGEIDQLYKLGVTAVFSTNRNVVPKKEQEQLMLTNITLATETALRIFNGVKK